MYRIFALSLYTLTLAAPSYAQPRILGTCEGDSNGIAYLIRLTEDRGKFRAQVFRYQDSGHGDEDLIEVDRPLEFYDDYFEDEGIAHNLMNVGASFDHAEEAVLQISYRADGDGNGVPSLIRFVNEQNDVVQIRDGVCDIKSERLSR